jgi:hypothetical protein
MMLAVASGSGRAPVTCCRCSGVLVPNPKAAVLSNADRYWVCDPCGEREAPELMIAVRALRKGEARS